MAVTINYEQIRITELDSYLFGQGTHYEIYNKFCGMGTSGEGRVRHR